MKKMMAVLGASIFTFTGMSVFAGCSEQEEGKTVMNVSLNPEVEFVLDADNKVVSVNALNEEGNLIVSAEVFTGKSAEEAAQLFVKVSKETGFLVKGNASDGENEISISFSGDEEKATALYNDVKGKVQEYLSENGVTAQIEAGAALTEEYLQTLAIECAPYIDAAEIEALEAMELVELVYESRKETAEMYSQELKNAYYAAKEIAMEQTELETLKSKVSGAAAIVCEAAYQAYVKAVEEIEKIRMETLVDENSGYQKALREFREAKIAYLNYREEVAAMDSNEVPEAYLTALNNYEDIVKAKETALLQAGELANKTLNTLKSGVQTAYDYVITTIEDASVKVSKYLDEVSQKQQEAKAQFFTDFETGYADAITAAKNGWAEMKSALEEKTAEEQA